MASAKPGGGGRPQPKKARGHGGNAHYMVNLDTGHHLPTINSKPVKTTPTEKALIGPDTLIAASNMGDQVMPYMNHMMAETKAHAHVNKHAKTKHPHAHQVAAAKEASMLPGRAA